jgi:hypothetical protein
MIIVKLLFAGCCCFLGEGLSSDESVKNAVVNQIAFVFIYLERERHFRA